MVDSVMNALIKEAQFTREMLGSGVTQIRKANYATKGVYFQAFTSLSTGLERIGKLCILLDYYLDNDNSFPSTNYLKKEIGHDILLLYKKSKLIIEKRTYSLNFLNDLDKEIYQNILTVLSEFAVGDRYSNLNYLINNKEKNDPIASWYVKVDQEIFKNCVSEKKKLIIDKNAHEVARYLKDFSFVLHSSETEDEITDIEDASRRTGMIESVAPYRQLYLLHIIRFWVELINNLQHQAIQKKDNKIPCFSEIFALFLNDDSYIKTRKTWNNF